MREAWIFPLEAGPYGISGHAGRQTRQEVADADATGCVGGCRAASYDDLGRNFITLSTA
jgi:hypothetical protein